MTTKMKERGSVLWSKKVLSLIRRLAIMAPLLLPMVKDAK
jgi:hypothetical protein